MWKWLKRYPRLYAIGGVLMMIGGGLAAIEGIWGLFSSDPLVPFVYNKVSPLLPTWPRYLLIAWWVLVTGFGILLLVQVFRQTKSVTSKDGIQPISYGEEKPVEPTVTMAADKFLLPGETLEQFNEAMRQESNKDGVIVINHPPQVEIGIGERLFGVSGDNGFPPNNSSGDITRWLRLSLYITKNVPLETLGLVIDKNPPISAFDWEPGKAALYYYFQIPDWVKANETRIIQVQAFAAEKIWGSINESIKFPV